MAQFQNALAAILFFVVLASAQTVTFAPAELIGASDGLNGNARPRIACDDDGTIHLAWAAGFHNNADILYARMTDGEDFGESVVIDDVLDYYTNTGDGVSIRVSGDVVAVGYEDFVPPPGWSIWVRRSIDGGLTWQNPTRAHPVVADNRELQSIGLFPDGRMAECWLDLSGTDELAWTAQNDQGQFSAPELITDVTPNPVCECCSPDQIILDDGQTVLVAYRNNDSNTRTIYVIRSTDGGETWETNTPVDQTGWEINGCPSTGPSLAADGQHVVMTWMSAADGLPRIWTARSLNGGETWESAVELDPAGSEYTRNYPQTAVRGDIAVAVWQQYTQLLIINIYCSISLDGGATWSEAARVAPADFMNQIQPTVAITPDNEIEAVWTDWYDGAPKLYHARGTVDELASDPLQSELPATFSLSAYPNPFNPETRITFDLTTSSNVQLDVFDINGRMVEQLLNGNLGAGSHDVAFNGANLSAGMYFARLQTGNQIGTTKLLLLK